MGIKPRQTWNRLGNCYMAKGEYRRNGSFKTERKPPFRKHGGQLKSKPVSAMAETPILVLDEDQKAKAWEAIKSILKGGLENGNAE